MTAAELINRLLTAEVRSDIAPDARRILSAERQGLQVRLANLARAEAGMRSAKDAPYPGLPKHARRVDEARAELDACQKSVGRATVEAQRVADMWGVQL